MTDPPNDISIRVEQYVKLRDKIRDMDDKHKETMRPYRELLEQLNSMLLQHLQWIGASSASTTAGTVYRTEKKTATLQDAGAFRSYVVQNSLYELADIRANITAVADY